MFQSNTAVSAPLVDRKDLELGRIVGQGSFGVVHEILSFNTAKAHSALNCNDEPDGDHDAAAFAMKSISYDCRKDEVLLSRALKEIMNEAHFLSFISHQNILKLRGMSANTGKPSAQEYFLILDFLHETLDQRLKRWGEKLIKTKGFLKKMRRNLFRKRTKENGEVERLLIACDIIRALAYLHQNGIMHRDVNPRNIGFDRFDETKLFDFGSAKEFQSQSDNIGRHHTAQIGTYRYMSPEIFCGRPYHETVDIYSMGILLWEIMTLEKPFGCDLDIYTFAKNIVEGGVRPDLDIRSWSKNLKETLVLCWSQDPSLRPKATDLEKAVILEARDHGTKKDGSPLCVKNNQTASAV